MLFVKVSNFFFFFCLIMDSKPSLGQGYFQRVRRPTRSAPADRGNAGRAATKRGHGLLLLVSLLATDATESLRQ